MIYTFGVMVSSIFNFSLQRRGALEPYSSMFDGLFYNFGLPYIDADPRKPPPEVYIFIFWLFASFAIFPLVQFFKMRAFQNVAAGTDRLKLYVKYEFYFIFLSALSKLPLLLLFMGGSKAGKTQLLMTQQHRQRQKKIMIIRILLQAWDLRWR